MEEKSLPLVSVAIITYNQKEYLKECIESVLEQDYKNIEIVIADDFSTDGTQDMLKEYDKQYPNKFVLRLAEKNQGITANSNVVLFACSGEYIAITGGDDIFLPTKISEQVEFLEQNKEYSLCGTYTNHIDKDSNIIRKVKDYKNKKTPSYSVCELIESNTSLISVVSYMFKKEYAPEGGFDYRLPVASDGLFYFHIASKGKIWIIPKFLTSYRVHYSHSKRLGYKDDAMVSITLSEYFFPQCICFAKKARASLFYGLGRFYAQEGKDFEKSKYYLKGSLSYQLKIKCIVAYLFAILKIKK